MITQFAQLIGVQGSITVGELHIDVRVLDAKQSYGKTRYLVQPLAGSGQQWMEQVNVR